MSVLSILLIEPPNTIKLAMAERPDWQPISRLPLIGSMIDGMLQDAEEHYQTLLQASPKPHRLDDYTVGRVFEVFGRQKDDLWLLGEHFKPGARKSRDVVRLIGWPSLPEMWQDPIVQRETSDRVADALRQAAS